MHTTLRTLVVHVVPLGALFLTDTKAAFEARESPAGTVVLRVCCTLDSWDANGSTISDSN